MQIKIDAGKRLCRLSGRMDNNRRLMAASIVCACLVPPPSFAFSLGDIAVHSRLGQPLRATVPVLSAPGETVEDNCLSLGKRPQQGDDGSVYLTQGRLSLETADGRKHIKIVGYQAISEPFITLRVQVDCAQSSGRYSRVFTVLLDPEEYISAPTSSSGPAREALVEVRLPAAGTRGDAPRAGNSWEIRPGDTLPGIAAAIYPDSHKMQRRMVKAIVHANPQLAGNAGVNDLPAGTVIQIPALRRVTETPSSLEKSRRSQPQSPSMKLSSQGQAEAPVQEKNRQPEEQGFRLKLSTGEVDTSSLGKMTEEQRLRLREKQLLLDADNQIANSLALKSRIKQLEDQLAELQVQLKKTDGRLTAAEQQQAASPAAQASAPAAEPKPEATPAPVVAVNKEVPQSSGDFIDALADSARWLVLGLIASVGVFVGLIRHRRAREETLLKNELAEEALEESKVYRFAPKAVETASPTAAATAAADQAEPETAEGEAPLSTMPSTTLYGLEGETVTFTEAESVLEEADLYLAYGWGSRAVELLQDYLEKHQEDRQIWLKLFEIYRVQNMKAEFAKLAARFEPVGDPEAWRKVQVLGQELDPGNPLYGDMSSAALGATPEAIVEIKLPEEAPPQEPEKNDDPLNFSLDFLLKPEDRAGSAPLNESTKEASAPVEHDFLEFKLDSLPEPASELAPHEPEKSDAPLDLTRELAFDLGHESLSLESGQTEKAVEEPETLMGKQK